MALLRTRNAALLLKIQSAEGTFDTPSASTDGLLVEAPAPRLAPQNVQTDEVTGSLDPEAPIVGGMQAQIGFSLYLKGGGTPGVAPEFGDLLKCCGLAEVLTVTSISAATIAAVAATPEFTDSGSGLAALTVGTVIHVSGFATAANNGEFLVTASAAGAIEVTKPDGSAAGLVNEAASATITIRRGIAAGTAAAGTTTGFTSAAPWAATADLYRGMPVLLSGNPATPVFAFISDYTVGRVATLTDLMGSALTTSTIASIPANVLYKPSSAAASLASVEFYRDGVKWSFKDCRGTISFEFAAAGAIRANVTLSGVFVSKTDAAVPTVTYDGTRPGTFRASRMLVDRVQTALSRLTLDLGNELQFPPDPNEDEGFAAPLITRRRMTGSMDPFETLIATRDIMTAFREGETQIIHARALGGAAATPGQRCGAVVPAAFYESYQPGANGNLATEEVGFFCRGQDAGFFLNFY